MRCLIVAAVTAVVVARPDRAADPAPPPRPAGPPPAVTVTCTTREAARAFQRSSHAGWVTAVDRESITVQGLNLGVGDLRSMTWDPDRCVNVSVGWPLRVEGPDGQLWRPYRLESIRREDVVMTFWPGRRVVLRRVDEPPRRFLAGLALADGQSHPGASPSESYRLADVRVGDKVGLTLGDTDLPGQELYRWCATISILRRPGGKVPPAPRGEHATDQYRHHERMQADQDWEERRAPYPEKYHPGGNVPQVAPEPREAEPRPPGR